MRLPFLIFTLWASVAGAHSFPPGKLLPDDPYGFGYKATLFVTLQELQKIGLCPEINLEGSFLDDYFELSAADIYRSDYFDFTWDTARFIVYEEISNVINSSGNNAPLNQICANVYKTHKIETTRFVRRYPLKVMRQEYLSH